MCTVQTLCRPHLNPNDALPNASRFYALYETSPGRSPRGRAQIPEQGWPVDPPGTGLAWRPLRHKFLESVHQYDLGLERFGLVLACSAGAVQYSSQVDDDLIMSHLTLHVTGPNRRFRDKVNQPSVTKQSTDSLGDESWTRTSKCHSIVCNHAEQIAGGVYPTTIGSQCIQGSLWRHQNQIPSFM